MNKKRLQLFTFLLAMAIFLTSCGGITHGITYGRIENGHYVDDEFRVKFKFPDGTTPSNDWTKRSRWNLNTRQVDFQQNKESQIDNKFYALIVYYERFENPYKSVIPEAIELELKLFKEQIEVGSNLSERSEGYNLNIMEKNTSEETAFGTQGYLIFSFYEEPLKSELVFYHRYVLKNDFLIQVRCTSKKVNFNREAIDKMTGDIITSLEFF